MQRNNPPKDKKKQKIEFIIESLSHGWLPDERETSVLFDYKRRKVCLETSYPSTAKRWFGYLWGEDDVRWDTNADNLKIEVPWEFCRSADLILKPQYRKD